MINARLIESSARFSGMDALMDKLPKDCMEKPSKSQWYRFKQQVLNGNAEQILAFLHQREDRKKVRGEWTFDVEDKKFYEWLGETLVSPIVHERVKSLTDLIGPNTSLGLELDLPKQYMDADAETLDELKLAVLRAALCAFIDRVLLAQQRTTFKTVFEGSDSRMEVKFHEE